MPATKRIYEETASILRHELMPLTPASTYSATVKRFAVMFKSDNPRFDTARFVDACLTHPGGEDKS